MILVTGASGFLGNHLIQLLSEKGEQVRALYHKHPPANDLKKISGIEWLQCDMLDIASLEAALQNISHVYHCAAIVSFNPRRRNEMLHFNIESTANLVNLCLDMNIKKVVHVSSVAALGRNEKKDHEITEEEQWDENKHNSVYSKSKYLSEMEVWRGMAEGLKAVIINPGIILGAGDWNEGSANIMKVVNKEFPFYTLGINAWVDVKDVVKAMYLLMQSDITAERFIMSAGNYQYRYIFNAMAKALHKKLPSIKVGTIATAIVAQLYLLKTRLLGGPATITPETSRNVHLQCFYNNTKLKIAIPGFSYISIEDTIAGMALAFKADIAKK